MTITASPADKYAFLFAGRTLASDMKDLDNVFQTLTKYYQYPAANITVVLGSTPEVATSFSSATLVNITNAAQLQASLATFAASASGPTVSGAGSKTALLYFTGGGVKQAGVSRLAIDGAADGSNNVDPAWLQARLSGGAFGNCHVNVVMQQSFSGGFKSALIGAGIAQWSFTSACNDAETSWGNVTEGGFFTSCWVRGLKLEQLPAGAPDAGKFADQLGSVGDGADRLVSLQEATAFGKQVHDLMGYGAFSTPSCDGIGPQWLGLPSFLIRDNPGWEWWESPDIYLTYPNHPWLPAGDHYITDMVGVVPPSGKYNNTINVDVRNVGTHPVRIYSLGVELFKTGAGATDVPITECNRVPSEGLLLPISPDDIEKPADKKDHYEWNTPFYVGTTHECVKAEAERLCSDVTFAWDVEARDNEGQRNTDEMTLIPPPPAPPQHVKNLQGFMEHIYGIENRFETPHRFILVFPEKLAEYEDMLDLRWFALPREGQAEANPLEVVTEPVPHIPFLLKGKESKNIILRLAMRPEFKLEGALRLPFDIMVQGDWPGVDRQFALADRLPSFVRISGFTVVVRRGSAALKGAVLDAKKRPVADARVFLRTVDDRLGAVLTTDRNGRYNTTQINPNIYRIWAEAGDWRSQERIAVLFKGDDKVEELQLTEVIAATGKRIKVILDKIRILDDHDPCIKGKGELTFTAVVMPDDDASRKQVTRLPSQGVYKVSDKPGENSISLGVTLFEGLVKNRALSITISGKEIDLFDPDDELNRYHRVFSGNPESWCGQYSPSDEYLDQEDVGDWALWYRIVSD